MSSTLQVNNIEPESGSSVTITGLTLTSVSITGGTITGITDLAVADGGTGASTAGGALTNLGVSAFAQTVLDDTTAGAARTTLDAAQLTSSLTEDTAPDKIADFLHGYDASGSAEKKLRLVTAVARSLPRGQGLLVNGKMTFTVGSSALTLAVKTAAGGDPSATDPVYAFFPSATLTEGGFDIVAITAALSMTVSSGSTLGHASAKACHVFGYLINNSGAAEIAVSNLPPDYPGTFGSARLISTTAEGGAGAADSATGIYSTTARSNVPWVCVAKALSTQTTAGTWASAMTQVDAAPFQIPMCAFSATGNAVQLLATATASKLSMNTETYDPDGTYDAATNYRHQPNAAGFYLYDVAMGWGPPGANQQYFVAGYKNGSEVHRNQGETAGTNFIMPHASVLVLMNGTTDYFEMYGYQNSGGNSNVDISDPRWAHFSGQRQTGGQ